MKSRTLLSYLAFFLLTGLFMTFQSGCSKDKDEEPAPTQTVTDIDGNVYHTVVIGTQTWMVENLKVTKYRNGDPITMVPDTSWGSLTAGAYCWYVNDISNKATYGALYNWFAATDARNIAPTGYHVPTDADWTTLVNYLGGGNTAGAKIKEAGTAHWSSGNTGTNESGLTIIPGGTRIGDGTFSGLHNYANFWSVSEFDATKGWERELNSTEASVYRYINPKVNGFSVRCVKD